jgi:hypothetical protein
VLTEALAAGGDEAMMGMKKIDVAAITAARQANVATSACGHQHFHRSATLGRAGNHGISSVMGGSRIVSASEPWVEADFGSKPRTALVAASNNLLI